MGMLPIFILGLAVGVLVDRAILEYKKDTPSTVKIEAMENIISGLKEDIQLLEKTNEDWKDRYNKLVNQTKEEPVEKPKRTRKKKEE